MYSYSSLCMIFMGLIIIWLSLVSCINGWRMLMCLICEFGNVVI